MFINIVDIMIIFPGVDIGVAVYYRYTEVSTVHYRYTVYYKVYSVYLIII